MMRNILTDLTKRIDSPHDSYKKWLFIIPDLAAAAQAGNLSEADFKLLLSQGVKHGMVPLFIGSVQDLVNNTYNEHVKIMIQLVDQVFLGQRISDQNHTRYPYITNEPSLKSNQGYILYPDGYEFVQLMKV